MAARLRRFRWLASNTASTPPADRERSLPPFNHGKLRKLVARLNAIAKKNEDKFKYCIDIESPRVGQIRFLFQAVEPEGHWFVSGKGLTIEEAVANAGLEIPEALASWGYTE